MKFRLRFTGKVKYYMYAPLVLLMQRLMDFILPNSINEPRL